MKNVAAFGFFLFLSASPAISDPAISIAGQVEFEGISDHPSGHDALGKVDKPPNLLIRIVFPDGTSSPCREYGGGILCRDYEVPGKPQIIRVELSSFGYKKSAVNVPSVKFDSVGDAQVNIGAIRLVRSELPSVEQIVLSHSQNGRLHFRITLHNPLQEELLVRQIGVYVRQQWESGISCAMPSPHEISVNELLTVVGGAKSQKTVVGSFEDVSQGRSYLVKASGELDSDPCEHHRILTLQMPSDIRLPKADFTTVEIELPKHFGIEEEQPSDVHRHFGPYVGIEGSTSGIALRDGDDFVFFFETPKGDEMPIKGDYRNYRPTVPSFQEER